MALARRDHLGLTDNDWSGSYRCVSYDSMPQIQREVQARCPGLPIAAHRPCPGDPAGWSVQSRRGTDRPGYGASSGDTLRRAVTTVRSESKSLLPMVSKAQAALRSMLPLR